MAGIDKVVVTNMGALKAKYGARVTRIRRALRDLELANGQRGLVTQVVALDDAKQMAAYSAPVVEQPDDPVQVKVAIDAVYAALQPHYLMILGAVDIVPHQWLDNLTFSADDTNHIVFSDLPYACDAPYSTRIADFLGPTRVVGRLPDVTGYSNPRYLESLLLNAAAGGPQPVPGASRFFGISAEKWSTLTATVAGKALSGARVHCSPDEGPAWPDEFLARPIHFINCHGGQSDCRYYGEPTDEQPDPYYPVAHDSACVANRLKPGTVVAAECCYGAQLYDPADAGGVVGISSTYLASGAFAFFGSTTAAYGGHVSNQSADLLCQYFLQHVLGGASSGRATLAARQEFVAQTDLEHRTFSDPVDLKTLAQFVLLGDPSLQPVTCAADLGSSDPTGFTGTQEAVRVSTERAERRARLVERGQELQRTRAVAHHPVTVADAQKTINRVLRLAKVKGWGHPKLESFSASQSPLSEDATPPHPTLVHVITRPGRSRSAPYPVIELIIAKEVDGNIVSIRHVTSR